MPLHCHRPPDFQKRLFFISLFKIMKNITQGELSTLLYCLESMAVDFPDGEESTADFESLFEKVESLADQTPDADDLQREVISIQLINN